MTKQTKTAKRPYRKPQLEQVQLVAEEAVLAGCKTAGASGPQGQSAACQGNVNCTLAVS